MIVGNICVYAEDLKAGTDGYIFLKEKISSQYRAENMINQTKNFAAYRSTLFLNTDLYTMGTQNKIFLIDHIQDTYEQTDESALLEQKNSLSRMKEVDIWNYLEKKEDRKKALDHYISLGEQTLQINTRESGFLTSKISQLKTRIKEKKKEISVLEKSFKNALASKNPDATIVSKLQNDIIEKTTTLSELETEYQKNIAINGEYSKEVIAFRNKINALKENYDAVVKNVRVKEASGKFIDVIIQ